MNELLADIFEEGIKIGEFKDHPPLEMANVFSSVVFSTIWLIMGDPENYGQKKRDTIFSIFMEGVYA